MDKSGWVHICALRMLHLRLVESKEEHQGYKGQVRKFWLRKVIQSSHLKRLCLSTSYELHCCSSGWYLRTAVSCCTQPNTMKGKGGQCICLGVFWIHHFKSTFSEYCCMHAPQQMSSVGIGGFEANKFIFQCYFTFRCPLLKSWLKCTSFFHGCGLPLNAWEGGQGYRNLG